MPSIHNENTWRCAYGSSSTCCGSNTPNASPGPSPLIKIPPMNKRIPLTADAVRCSTCGLGQFCLPIGMEPEDASRMDELVQERIRIPKGQALFHTGDTLDAVYGIRFGTLKTFLERADGRQQITGFHLAGEIVGLDGLAGARHASTSVA